MIKPTVGRIVWYHPGPNDPGGVVPDAAQAAIITHVWSETCVNLCVFNSNGVPYSKTSVYLLQEGNTSLGAQYAEWMPYQKGQAAKTEELESKLAGSN